MKIGADVKVFLAGESPWGEVLEIDGDRVKIRIVNKLLHEYSEHEQAQFMKREWGTVEPLPNLHGQKQGDELWCEWDGEHAIFIGDDDPDLMTFHIKVRDGKVVSREIIE